MTTVRPRTKRRKQLLSKLQLERIRPRMKPRQRRKLKRKKRKIVNVQSVRTARGRKLQSLLELVRKILVMRPWCRVKKSLVRYGLTLKI
jgi:hypothetical protein